MCNKKMTLPVALIPIVFLIFLLIINIIILDSAVSIAGQLSLIFSSILTIFIGLYYNIKWKHILHTVKKNIKTVIPALILLLLIGGLSGTWLISGIIPAMIFYGLKILNPDSFLFVVAIISAIISLATGSSWSTIATVGIAFLGIGTAIGIPTGIVAGAIISGAYFGDKMSPLSETTNMAAAVCEVNLFDHIKYMMYTTIPSFLITLIIFLIIGLNFETSISSNQIDEALNIISNKFEINLWLFLVPISVIILIINKVSAIKSLFIGTLLGSVFAIIFQEDILFEISNLNKKNFISLLSANINAITGDINFTQINTDINEVFNIPEDERSSLLKSSGMYGMFNTILLMICAMIFSGCIESTKILTTISKPIIRYAKTKSKLIGANVGTCIFFNITTCDQYMSLVVPGRMFSDSYKDNKLAPENLSRTIEDGGTVTSVLIPWNSCGATQSAVLGITTLTYLPFCFFNILSPIMTLVFSKYAIKIKKLN